MHDSCFKGLIYLDDNLMIALFINVWIRIFRHSAVDTWIWINIVWDPYMDKDIKILEQIQRKAGRSRFVTGDYYSRDTGSMTRMLQELNLPTLQQRRKDARLATFLYTIQSGLVPGIPCENYLIPQKIKRIIREKNSSTV